MRADEIVLEFGPLFEGYDFIGKIAKACVDSVDYFVFVAHHTMDSFSADAHLLPGFLSEIDLKIIFNNLIELLNSKSAAIEQKLGTLFLHSLSKMFEVVICLLTDRDQNRYLAYLA